MIKLNLLSTVHKYYNYISKNVTMYIHIGVHKFYLGKMDICVYIHNNDYYFWRNSCFCVFLKSECDLSGAEMLYSIKYAPDHGAEYGYLQKKR